jgi:surfactin synthase thioesterase subunit
MAETDVMSVLQNANSAKTKFLFIIGIKDAWVKSASLKNIFSKYFPQAKILEMDGGHLLNETHATELCKLILQELTYRSDSI